MLHLETRIDFKERVFASLDIIEVLHRTDTAVTNLFGQTNRPALELGAQLSRRHRDRTLFYNLLVSPLHGTIPAIESYRLSVRIGYHLHLQVPRVDAQLLNEYWRARHLGLHLGKPNPQLLHR